MKTIEEILDLASEIAIELASIADDPLTAEERRSIVAASAQCASAAAILAATVERMHCARVAALGELCRCGHDRGEHLCESPHACEHTDDLITERTMMVDPCMCAAFESTVRPLFPKRDTIRTKDDSATERPASLAEPRL
jgi:hypothetical protein